MANIQDWLSVTYWRFCWSLFKDLYYIVFYFFKIIFGNYNISDGNQKWKIRGQLVPRFFSESRALRNQRSYEHIWKSYIQNSIIILSWVYREAIQWPAPSWLVGLIIGRELKYQRGQGFKSRTSLNIFRLSFCNYSETCIKQTPKKYPTPHARHQKCERLPPTNFSIFTVKDMTSRTALICITPRWIQYSRVLFSISFLLYRACLAHLISSNLNCNLCLWYYDQLVHFNNKINAKVYRHSLWEYSKHFHCSFEWHLTPHMTVSIETAIRWTLQHSFRVSPWYGFHCIKFASPTAMIFFNKVVFWGQNLLISFFKLFFLEICNN